MFPLIPAHLCPSLSPANGGTNLPLQDDADPSGVTSKRSLNDSQQMKRIKQINEYYYLLNLFNLLGDILKSFWFSISLC